MKILKTRAAMLISFFTGFLSAYIVFCFVSFPFLYYARQTLGFSPDYSEFLFIASLIAFAVSFTVFSISANSFYDTTRSESWVRLNKFDYIITSGFFLTIFLVCAAILVSGPNIYSMAICPFLSYGSFMLWYMTTVYRIRTRTLRKTMRWMAFYRIYPPNKLIGLTLLFFSIISAIFLCAGILMEQALIIIIAFIGFLLLTLCAELCIQLNDIKVTFLSHAAPGHEEYFQQLMPVIDELTNRESSYDKAMSDKIKSERFKTELITNVSHDIKTPLTSIINYIDLLKKLDIKNEEFIEYTDVIEKKSHRLRLLIEDLMEASKAGTGNLAVNFEEINLGELLGQLAGELDEKLLKSDLQLIIRQPEGECIVRADGRHLWRIMENIFGNAVKYSLRGTRIYAEVERRPGKIHFSLKNISHEQLGPDSEKLTEQFVRGDEARRSEGSGLGLYIAKSLSELMGADFDVRIAGDMFEVNIILDEVA